MYDMDRYRDLGKHIGEFHTDLIPTSVEVNYNCAASRRYLTVGPLEPFVDIDTEVAYGSFIGFLEEKFATIPANTLTVDALPLLVETAIDLWRQHYPLQDQTVYHAGLRQYFFERAIEDIAEGFCYDWGM